MRLNRKRTIDHCQTADDVRKAAREVVAKRRDLENRPPPPPAPEAFRRLIFKAAIEDITENCRPEVREIQQVCCYLFGMTDAELLSRRQHHLVVKARHVGFILSKLLTKQSFMEIGRRFGMDHTSVMSAVRKLAWISDALVAERCHERPLLFAARRAKELIEDPLAIVKKPS